MEWKAASAAGLRQKGAHWPIGVALSRTFLDALKGTEKGSRWLEGPWGRGGEDGAGVKLRRTGETVWGQRWAKGQGLQGSRRSKDTGSRESVGEGR